MSHKLKTKPKPKTSVPLKNVNDKSNKVISNNRKSHQLNKIIISKKKSSQCSETTKKRQKIVTIPKQRVYAPSKLKKKPKTARTATATATKEIAVIVPSTTSKTTPPLPTTAKPSKQPLLKTVRDAHDVAPNQLNVIKTNKTNHTQIKIAQNNKKNINNNDRDDESSSTSNSSDEGNEIAITTSNNIDIASLKQRNASFWDVPPTKKSNISSRPSTSSPRKRKFLSDSDEDEQPYRSKPAPKRKKPKKMKLKTPKVAPTSNHSSPPLSGSSASSTEMRQMQNIPSTIPQKRKSFNADPSVMPSNIEQPPTKKRKISQQPHTPTGLYLYVYTLHCSLFLPLCLSLFLSMSM